MQLDEGKIKKAFEEGRLVNYNEIFSSYPKKIQERIKSRARYLMVAMELIKLRKTKKLSQGELADKMKVKREFISRLESGEQNITLETLYKVAEATGKKFETRFV